MRSLTLGEVIRPPPRNRNSPGSLWVVGHVDSRETTTIAAEPYGEASEREPMESRFLVAMRRCAWSCPEADAGGCVPNDTGHVTVCKGKRGDRVVMVVELVERHSAQTGARRLRQRFC